MPNGHLDIWTVVIDPIPSIGKCIDAPMCKYRSLLSLVPIADFRYPHGFVAASRARRVEQHTLSPAGRERGYFDDDDRPPARGTGAPLGGGPYRDDFATVGTDGQIAAPVRSGRAAPDKQVVRFIAAGAREIEDVTHGPNRIAHGCDDRGLTPDAPAPVSSCAAIA